MLKDDSWWSDRQFAEKVGEKKGATVMNADLFEMALGEIERMAREMPAEEFFERLDFMVENSRRFINSFEDCETRGRLREIYKTIVRYALDCKIKASACAWN